MIGWTPMNRLWTACSSCTRTSQAPLRSGWNICSLCLMCACYHEISWALGWLFSTMHAPLGGPIQPPQRAFVLARKQSVPEVALFRILHDSSTSGPTRTGSSRSVRTQLGMLAIRGRRQQVAAHLDGRDQTMKVCDTGHTHMPRGLRQERMLRTSTVVVETRRLPSPPIHVLSSQYFDNTHRLRPALGAGGGDLQAAPLGTSTPDTCK